MKMKKYEAHTEQEAIEMVKNELGPEALVLNIKKVQPKGLFSFLKKAYVEVTAAYEDKPAKKNIASDALKNVNASLLGEAGSENRDAANAAENNDIKKSFENTHKIVKQQKTINELEKKLNATEELLEEVMYKLSVSYHNSNAVRKYDNSMLQFFYEKLISQGVSLEITEVLLEDIENVDDLDKLDINLIVKVVYNRIIRILGEPKTLDVGKKGKGRFAKNIVFIGPTGVGKTTTIAKLSSKLIFDRKLSVGFITADTYRIAAVEQLKTYAEILNADVEVVYNNEDILEKVDALKAINDVIFIDTAGRSHKNDKNVDELKEFLNIIPDPEVYLVLSITTSYDDLLSIVKAYSAITDFKIIFTKLDETNCYGSILNICYNTGREISYAANGQNVPDDIEIISPEKIAKALLGSM